ncbi:MAG: enoyl-CoA hydratase-related protein [Desulfobacterales bacterium]
MEFTEILYEKKDGVARITINRPAKYNACTPVTVYELTQALTDAWVDRNVGVVVPAAPGIRPSARAGTSPSGNRADIPEQWPPALEVGWQQVSTLIRTIPKPVIARVNGYAIGGGHVFQVVCDFSIAAEHAKFGQAGPKVGSFDPGFGTGDLVRAVGLKKAKEIWFLCRQYAAARPTDMGLVARCAL